MDHGPAVEHEDDHASAYKTSLGLKMFVVYGLVYLGFILINTLNPRLMETKVIFGVNLAVAYGFGLILLAIISGLIYNALSTREDDRLEAAHKDGEA